MRSLGLTLFCPALLALSAALSAQEAGNIVVTTVAQQTEVLTDPSGDTRTQLVPVTKVLPGDEVTYTITFKNVGGEPVENVTVTNPVPEHMSYLDGSAFGPGTAITFSVDGGHSFAPAGTLAVALADGSTRPAAASDYTHIRWTYVRPAEPGELGIARFKAVVL